MAIRPPEVVRSAEHAPRAVVVVESVHPVSRDAADTAPWHHLAEHVEASILPEYAGRLTESASGRLVLEFYDVRPALAAAFAIQEEARLQQIPVKMGLESDEALSEGNGRKARILDFAGRLTALTGPDEIIVSASVRSQLTPTLDAEVEDLGEHALSGAEEPVRAYRVAPPGSIPAEMLAPLADDVRPILAIVPFTDRVGPGMHHLFGELLAEELIRTLSSSHELNVISRLSTTALRGRNLSLSQISDYLSANYVLSGSYRVLDLYFGLDLQLAEATSGVVLWKDQLEGRVDAVVSGQRELIHQVVAGISRAIESREVDRALTEAMPSLENYTLLLGAIGLMHRNSLRDFQEAHRLLEELISRPSRHSLPRAWLAKWHVFRVQQGWSPDPHKDAQRALQLTTTALESDPNCSLALVMDGLVHTNLVKRLDIAQDRYDLALQSNPNESLAWLLKGTLQAFRGEGLEAVGNTQRALMLSPLDPFRYYYDSLAATACLAAHRFDLALDHAKRSLRANRMHTSTIRALAVSQWGLGRVDEARETTQQLLRLEPSLTVSRWLERSPSEAYPIGKEWAGIFRELGVPD